MEQMMPTMRAMEAGDLPVCPKACIEEDIEMDLSFTIMSDDTFEETWKLWPVPQNYTKFDAVFMDLYFTSLTSQVSLNRPSNKLSYSLFARLQYSLPPRSLNCWATSADSLAYFSEGVFSPS